MDEDMRCAPVDLKNLEERVRSWKQAGYNTFTIDIDELLDIIENSHKQIRTKQCENCIRKGLRECMYHGYPEETIPKSCAYKIGDAAVDTVYDVPVAIKGKTVWIVAESRFEWYEIKYICSSKEIALKKWEELRDELIKGNQEMVEYCLKEGFKDGKDWQKNIELLQELKPGESCACDYPDLKEWKIMCPESSK
jgi:hypothetical protein